jgi:hypothetical protein
VTARPTDYVHDMIASQTRHPDGSVDTETRPRSQHWGLANRPGPSAVSLCMVTYTKAAGSSDEGKLDFLSSA